MALSPGGSQGCRARLLLLEVERPRPGDPTDEPHLGRCDPGLMPTGSPGGQSRLLSLSSWPWTTWPLSPLLPEVLSDCPSAPAPGAFAALRLPSLSADSTS